MVKKMQRIIRRYPDKYRADSENDEGNFRRQGGNGGKTGGKAEQQGYEYEDYGPERIVGIKQQHKQKSQRNCY